jgi:hypothetical protein
MDPTVDPWGKKKPPKVQEMRNGHGAIIQEIQS